MGSTSTTSSDISLEAISSVAQIPAAEWDACANPQGAPYNPFVAHAFFHALEESGSASARAGWGARHLIARRHGIVCGVVPCYLKSHSQGEYVFDHAWADAYERAGGQYYPKLQATVPFTPASGPRLLVRPSIDAALVRDALGRGLVALCGAVKASSVHVTFAREEDCAALDAHDFLLRTDQQFHWRNDGYATFEDFLATLNSRHRKAIRRERRDALAAGVTIHCLSGRNISGDAWDAYYQFYIETGSRKWGRPYLNRAFYRLISETMPDDVLLVMAKRDGQWIAGAINFIGGDALFGRNWGAIEHHPFLHFEVCYYQAIEFAIARGLKRVEAGAQGEHKVARGYLPQTTYSAHYLADSGLRRAVRDYLQRERAYVAQAVRELTEAGPFRKDPEANVCVMPEPKS